MPGIDRSLGQASRPRQDARRKRISRSQRVGKGPKSVQSDVADHLSPPDATTRRRVLLVCIS